MRFTLMFVLALAACGRDSTSKKSDAAVQKDAPHNIDATTIDARLADAPIDAPQHVVAITCPSVPNATVVTSNNAFVYTPSAVTITQGQIVKFSMSSIHDVVPNATNSDPGLEVGFGETKCLQFNATGTFGFHCMPHGFMGTVTVN